MEADRHGDFVNTVVIITRFSCRQGGGERASEVLD